MIDIVQPSSEISRGLHRYLRSNLIPLAQLTFEAVLGFCQSDALVAIDGKQIIGVCALLKIAPQNASIACFKIAPKRDASEISDLLIRHTCERARRTSQRFLGCIPGRDRQPSDLILDRNGFTRLTARDLFFGQENCTASTGAVRNIADPAEAQELISTLRSPTSLTLHFRPILPTRDALKYALSCGSLLMRSDEKSGVALVFESKCIEAESSRYVLPDYLVVPSNLQWPRVGEVSVLQWDNARQILDAAACWLSERGITHFNLYTEESSEIRAEMHERGLDFLGAQALWGYEIKGPMDEFLLS